jgi:hypothetical protein
MAAIKEVFCGTMSCDGVARNSRALPGDVSVSSKQYFAGLSLHLIKFVFISFYNRSQHLNLIIYVSLRLENNDNAIPVHVGRKPISCSVLGAVTHSGTFLRARCANAAAVNLPAGIRPKKRQQARFAF